MSVLLLLVLRVAQAQDVPPPTVAPEAPPMPVETFGELSTWVGPRSPSDAGPLTGVSVAAGGAWLVGDIYGGVYRSDDRGRTWTVSLAALASPHSDKDDLQDIADRAKDAADEALEGGELNLDETDAADGDTLDAEDLVNDVEDARDEADGDERSPADGAIDQAEAEGRRDANADTPAYAWWHPLHDGVGFAGRPDGVYRTDDGAASWRRVADNGGAHDFEVLGGDLIVLALDVGVLFSTDLGDTWIEVDVGDGAHVTGLGQEAGALYAATDHGLYKTAGGLSWAETALSGVRVDAVVGDPTWTNGVWAITRDGLQRSDDGGASFRAAGRQPMLGTRGLRAVGDPGHLLAWGTDGVWESIDAGVSWLPWTRGLRDADIRGLAFADRQPIVAGPTGVWTSKSWRAPASPVARSKVPVDYLVGAATSRQGLDVDLLSLGRTAAVARLLPKLEVYADAKSWGKRDSDFLLLSTEESGQFEWRLGARFCFGGCASVVDVDYSDDYGSAEYTYEGEDVADVFVMGTDIVTEDEPVLAAIKTARSIQEYRFQLVDRVTDAWATHRRLLAQAEAIQRSSLGARLDYVLQVQEAEARLDLLTGGAFSRASLAPPESP